MTMIKNYSTPLAALAAGVLFLAGCGSDSTDDTPPLSANGAATAPAPADNDSTNDDSTQAATSSDDMLGVVYVEGVEYFITQVRNCEPLSLGPIDRELELQGLGTHDGQPVQIDVHVQTMSGMPYDDVSWAGPEGVYGGAEAEDTAITLDPDGTRVTGSATILDAMHQTDSISISFDLEVPAETIDCR